MARVSENAQRALAIDSTLAEARVALGILYMAVHEFDRAETELLRAVALEPENAAAHFQLGRTFIYRGRIAEAIDALERAKSLDPYHATIASWLGLALSRTPTIERANAESMRAWELDSLGLVVQNFVAVTAIETGQRDVARRVARWSPKNNFTHGPMAWVFGALDSLEAARQVVREIEARGGSLWLDQVNMSFAALALGDTLRALAAMEAGLERQEPIAAFHPLWLRMYDPIRSSARFRAIVRRIGLDEAALTNARRGSS